MAIKSRANKRHHLFIAQTEGIRSAHIRSHTLDLFMGPLWCAVFKLNAYQIDRRAAKLFKPCKFEGQTISILLLFVFPITFIEIVHLTQVVY